MMISVPSRPAICVQRIITDELRQNAGHAACEAYSQSSWMRRTTVRSTVDS